MGMSFMDVLLDATDATMIFVDQHQKLGGVVRFPINGNTDIRRFLRASDIYHTLTLFITISLVVA